MHLMNNSSVRHQEMPMLIEVNWDFRKGWLITSFSDGVYLIMHALTSTEA